MSKELILDDQRIVLIDTPGFDDTNKSDTVVLTSIAESLAKLWVKSCGFVILLCD
jgi:GTPase Era involved in 16S rRNA processing